MLLILDISGDVVSSLKSFEALTSTNKSRFTCSILFVRSVALRCVALTMEFIFNALIAHRTVGTGSIACPFDGGACECRWCTQHCAQFDGVVRSTGPTHYVTPR